MTQSKVIETTNSSLTQNHSKKIQTARWIPKSKDGKGMKILLDRQYIDLEGKIISQEKKGKDLPAIDRVNEIAESKSKMTSLLNSTLLFTNLPTLFYEELLNILAKESESPFPTIGKNKSPTVAQCILKMSKEHQKILGLNRWKELGWDSQFSYQNWLNTSVLFAFSGCGHYCQAPRVFDFDKNYNGSLDQFKLIKETEKPTFTNIFSIAGFECRGISPEIIREAIVSKQVRHYSTVIMQQILHAALLTHSTDIVFIPVGMGVFLTHDQAKMKEEMLSGWIDALNAYHGPAVSLRCCLMPGQFETIQQSIKNPNITLINHMGEDAYTVANAVQDDLGRKSMLINAGDHDWIVSFEHDKRPGQCSLGHTLFYSTSDEYFGLMTQFPAFSIANLKKFFTNIKNFICSTYVPQTELDKKNTATSVSTTSAVVRKHTIENKYAHKISNPENGRFHFFTVSGSDFKDLDPKFKKWSGDYLKTQILNDFKTQIENTASKQELIALKIKLMNSAEFQVLKTAQGLFTQWIGIDTSSVKAFEEMFQDQETNIKYAFHQL